MTAKTLERLYHQRKRIGACTSCNACVEACPVLIDPLSIIFEMRRFLVMEQSLHQIQEISPI